MVADNTIHAPESGLLCLVMLLRCHGVPAEVEQIRHRMGAAPIGVPEMLRYAKEIGVKARAKKTNWARLAKTPLPAIAALRDGNFLILGKLDEDKIVVRQTSSPRPVVMSRTEL